MYNDMYALMGMAGSALLNEYELSLTKKGITTYYDKLPEQLPERFNHYYTTDLTCPTGYEVIAKRKSYLVTYSINKDFFELIGKKNHSIRNCVNRYKDIVQLKTCIDVQEVIRFIDKWANDYGKAKYRMQLHTGMDKVFFEKYYNEKDFYFYSYHIDGQMVGYAAVSKHLNNGSLNYISGKKDHRYKGMGTYADYILFKEIYAIIGDYNICRGASNGTLLAYKQKFTHKTTPVYFIKYQKEMTESKTDVLKKELGIVPINVWDSSKQNWLFGKSKWNELIDTAGVIAGIENPRFATRENCLGEIGKFAKAVTGSVINGGASVLDPFVCELVLKLFMPKEGKSVYNPFGGGVQMGFVTGFFGYKYLATEIRKNQCDANNAICSAMQLKDVTWECADSSQYVPTEKFDLIFSCPPYYKVEKYVDYNGVIPDGELNSLPDYDSFRKLLFEGYTEAIASLRENRFVVIMVGDSRDKNGAYHLTESETEIFLRDSGLHVYNRIVYLEKQITRAALSTVSIQSRKLPKAEQKIIVAYKGNLNNIRVLFEQVAY